MNQEDLNREHVQRERAAIAMAMLAHNEQRYGSMPYITHLAAVRYTLASYGFAGNIGIAAWLHDIYEDTTITRQDVVDTFGAHVDELVWAVTGVGKNRFERTHNAYAKMKLMPEAIVIKLADRIVNVEYSKLTKSPLFDMYTSEWSEFVSHLLDTSARQVAESMPMWLRLAAAFGDTGIARG